MIVRVWPKITVWDQSLWSHTVILEGGQSETPASEPKQNPRWRPMCEVSVNKSVTINILIYVCYTNLVEHATLNNLL